ncbi:hypothetical protein D3C83_234040 [compost metagenome]
MVDAVVDRRQLKQTIASLLSVLLAKRRVVAQPELPLIAREQPAEREPRRLGTRQKARAAE